MKIISSFSDYYDRVQRLGYDDRIVYQREHQVLYFDKNRSLITKEPKWTEEEMDYLICNERFVISLCSKLYAGCYLRAGDYFSGSGYVRECWRGEGGFTYDLKKIKKLESNKLSYRETTDVATWEGSGLADLHIQHKAPVLLVTRDHKHTYLHLNPPLKYLDFFKVVDTYSVFQEIERFLGNQGVDAPDMVELSDRSKLIKHGFDLKESFRKAKESKKTRRK